MTVHFGLATLDVVDVEVTFPSRGKRAISSEAPRRSSRVPRPRPGDSPLGIVRRRPRTPCEPRQAHQREADGAPCEKRPSRARLGLLVRLENLPKRRNLLGSPRTLGRAPRPLRVLLTASRCRCDPPRQKREGLRSAHRALARVVHFVAIQTDPCNGESHDEIIGGERAIIFVSASGCPSPRVPPSVRTQSSRGSDPAAWARSIARTIRASAATSR